MRFTICLGLLTVLAAETVFAAETAVTLARDGHPAATIVIAAQPTRAAQFAAYELQWHLKQITGGDFQIVPEDQPAPGLAILVGDSQSVRAQGIKPDQFEKQEYLIRVTPESLILVGRDKDDRGPVQYNLTPSQQAYDTWPGIWDAQGTMYAVYDFLERFCSVRWFNPTQFGTDCRSTLTVRAAMRMPARTFLYWALPLMRVPDLLRNHPNTFST